MKRGPLFRLLGLERHLCPSCHRDNILRVYRFGRPQRERCRWCGASLVNWAAMTACVQSLAFAMGHTLQSAAETAARAMNAFGLAMHGTTWTVDVETATHDELKEGKTATRISRVQVVAPDEIEAKLVACQMATHGDRVPTRATVRTPEELRLEERPTRAAFNPLRHAVELRKDVM